EQQVYRCAQRPHFALTGPTISRSFIGARLPIDLREVRLERTNVLLKPVRPNAETWDEGRGYVPIRRSKYVGSHYTSSLHIRGRCSCCWACGCRAGREGGRTGP